MLDLLTDLSSFRICTRPQERSTDRLNILLFGARAITGRAACNCQFDPVGLRHGRAAGRSYYQLMSRSSGLPRNNISDFLRLRGLYHLPRAYMAASVTHVGSSPTCKLHARCSNIELLFVLCFVQTGDIQSSLQLEFCIFGQTLFYCLCVDA